MRSSGVLMPLSSLPGPYGIGCFGANARKFVDFLSDAGQKYWQILPLGPTGYGDSPYQSFSAFALNPYFVDLEQLEEQGLLTQAELESVNFGCDPMRVDYLQLYKTRLPVLRMAARRFNALQPGFEDFCKAENSWLPDYALFMALKEENGPISMQDWPDEQRRGLVRERAQQRLEQETRFWKIVQYWAFQQWMAVKAYANRHGVDIIGDLPIYVSADSAELWASPELFQTDKEGRLAEVAGCPPDGFSPKGQLWGNPLYDWDYHRDTAYAWWRSRMRHAARLYDVVRIDHFRGLESYYSIPAREQDARFGRWRPGPGLPFLKCLQQEIPGLRIIAEDLGHLTAQVRQLLADSGFPGMKVLQFAFDSREEGNYFPYAYPQNCVVYTGTHDNDTLEGWQRGAQPQDVAHALLYLDTTLEHLTKRMLRCALESVADTAVIPMQDWLGLGSEARINTPSTVGGNWVWRLQQRQLTPRLSREMFTLTKLYGRQ